MDVDTDAVIERLIVRGGARKEVRALILTSTRATPGARVDAYSDYDVIAVVDDVQSVADDSGWLSDFGQVLIAYWDPISINSTTGGEAVGNITQYVNGLKIDFSFWNRQHFVEVTRGPRPHPGLDAGHRVLVDKDDITTNLPAPTFRAYVPSRPDGQEFQRVITDFLIGVPYVAKSLLRDELLPAKWALDFDMRFNYLLTMLDWRVQCDHDWSLATGHLGRGLKTRLTPDLWEDLEPTFTGPDTDANWAALFAMVDLFERVAREVADRLGLDFPATLVANVCEHARRMRDGDFEAPPGYTDH